MLNEHEHDQHHDHQNADAHHEDSHGAVVDQDVSIPRASIKVLGIGGGGGNAVNSMAKGDLEGVEFIVANTDAQALHAAAVQTKIQIGLKVTKGLGAGSDPELGRRAAEEDLEKIKEHISGSDILFLTAGMGGGTGTGATPVIAQVARELGILTVGVVTKPFMFEGKRRQKQAENVIALLRDYVDTLIVIPNQKLLEHADPNISLLDAFAMVNDVLKQAIRGVSDVIVHPGHINVDFADVRSIMKGMGMAIMGIGRAKGEGRARQAALDAISSPLVEDVNIEGAQGVLINITGNGTLGLAEINEAATVIYDKASEDANIILGSAINPDLGDEILITVIATGFHQLEEASKAQEVIVEQQPPQEAQSDQDTDEAPEAIEEPSPQFDQQPAISLAKRTEEKHEEETSNVASSIDLNDLDTPTFIRKRAEAEEENENQ